MHGWQESTGKHHVVSQARQASFHSGSHINRHCRHVMIHEGIQVWKKKNRKNSFGEEQRSFSLLFHPKISLSVTLKISSEGEEWGKRHPQIAERSLSLALFAIINSRLEWLRGRPRVTDQKRPGYDS